MRSARLAIVVTTLVVSTTLGSGAQAAFSATDAPHGYRTVTVKKAGFSVAVPKAWLVLDVTRKNVTRIFDTLRKKFPKLAASLPADVESLVARNIVLLAAEQNPTFNTNLNVLSLPQMTAPPTVADLESSAKQLSPTAKLSSTLVGGASAVKITFQISNGQLRAVITEYLLLGPKGGLEFTFTASQDQPHRAAFATMVKSIRRLHS